MIIKSKKFNKLNWFKKLITGYKEEYEIVIDNEDGTFTIQEGYGKNVTE